MPELTAQDILLGSVGCKEEYVALLLDMHSYTSSSLCQEPRFTLRLENLIVCAMIERYNKDAELLKNATGSRKLLSKDEVSIVARCTICSKIQNLREDKNFAEYLGVSVESYRLEYRETLNMCFKTIEPEIHQVIGQIHNRLDDMH